MRKHLKHLPGSVRPSYFRISIMSTPLTKRRDDMEVDIVADMESNMVPPSPSLLSQSFFKPKLFSSQSFFKPKLTLACTPSKLCESFSEFLVLEMGERGCFRCCSCTLGIGAGKWSKKEEVEEKVGIGAGGEMETVFKRSLCPVSLSEKHQSKKLHVFFVLFSSCVSHIHNFGICYPQRYRN